MSIVLVLDGNQCSFGFKIIADIEDSQILHIENAVKLWWLGLLGIYKYAGIVHTNVLLEYVFAIWSNLSITVGYIKNNDANSLCLGILSIKVFNEVDTIHWNPKKRSGAGTYI